MIRIDIKPMSVNKAFKGRRFRSKEYDTYERSLMILLPQSKEKYQKEDMLRVEFVFGFSSRSSDLDNSIKQTLDILCKKYGFDDRQVWELEAFKKIVPKGKEYFEFRIIKTLPF